MKSSDKKNTENNFIRIFKVLIVVFFVVSIFYIVSVVNDDYVKRESMHVLSEKEPEKYNDKEKTLLDVKEKLNQSDKNHQILKSDNLNSIYMYDEVLTDEEKRYAESSNPEPLTLNEEADVDMLETSVAYQVYKKLKYKFTKMVIDMQMLGEDSPLFVVNKKKLDVNAILGNYNPNNNKHKKNNVSTYIIDKFSNVNVDFTDYDGDVIDNYRNIQDIMSMGSVYTYFHDPYNAKNYIDYCYDLFDNSYSYDIVIGDVYYCSGCMEYYDEDGEIDSMPFTEDKLPLSLSEQKKDERYEQKAGILDKMDLTKIHINDYSYDKYLEDIRYYGHNKLYNYCPGHVDLNVHVKCRCLHNTEGLIDIDNYGNDDKNFTHLWHGWEIDKINIVNQLANRDWSYEYGLDIEKIDYLKPLSQELINYYMCTLDNDISKDRKTIIETALKSVSKIPYYYGGKPRNKGYTTNHFNRETRADYNGRNLIGLDCSGWISWVYWTAFDRKIIKGEGTGGLSREGTRITRDELKPGDIIVRPGYDSHVMMFLSFAEDGKVKVIHENGSVNNVSVAIYEAYYPYYRRILNN